MAVKGMRRIHRRKLKLSVKITLIIIFIFFFITILNSLIKPFIQTTSTSKAKTVASEIINQVVLEELSKNSENYSELIHVDRDNNNNILSIQTDSIKINQLKSNITSCIQIKLSNYQEYELNLPLGTLINSEFFTGKGPNIPIKIALSGNIKTDITSNFTEAGINQTKHQIYLNVTSNITVIMPGYNNCTEVNTNLIIAETIIVGSVPQVFANLS